MNEINKKIEKENEKKSWVIAIGLHAVFFIVSGLGLFSCWTRPDPLNVAGEISVVFGKNDVGSGDNTEPAENPVEEPSENPSEETPQEQPAEAQASKPAENSDPVTDPDSDATPTVTKTSNKPKNITDKPATKDPVKNTVKPNPDKTDATKNSNNSKSTKTDKTDPKTMMGGGDEGKGIDKEAGIKGDPNALLNDKTGGTGGNTESGTGKGPNIDGWAFVKDPAKPSVTTPGIAHIKFTINAFGKVMSAKVIGGAFSASERAIIVKEFKKISLRKTSNVDYKTMYSGTYDWNLQY